MSKNKYVMHCDLSAILNSEVIDYVNPSDKDNRWNILALDLQNEGFQIEDTYLQSLFKKTDENNVYSQLKTQLESIHAKEGFTKEESSDDFKELEDFFKVCQVNNCIYYEAANDTYMERFDKTQLWGQYDLTFGFLFFLDYGYLLLYNVSDNSLLHNEGWKQLVLDINKYSGPFANISWKLLTSRLPEENDIQTLNRLLDTSEAFYAPPPDIWNTITENEAIGLVANLFSQNLAYGGQIEKPEILEESMLEVISYFSNKCHFYTNQGNIQEAIDKKHLVTWYGVSNYTFDCAVAIVDETKAIILLVVGED